jgi:hypothetical protein
MLKELIERGYKFEESYSKVLGGHFNIIKVTKPDGKEIDLAGRDDREIRFMCSGDPVITTFGKVYREYYNMSDDDYYLFEHGYSRRTGNYLKAVEDNLKLIKYDVSEEGAKFESIRTANIFVNGETQIGTIGDAYIAQTWTQADIDSFVCRDMFFSKNPTDEMIRTIYDVEHLKDAFLFNDANETYTCWECGRVVHWLDVEGNFHEKLKCLKEKYCGC